MNLKTEHLKKTLDFLSSIIPTKATIPILEGIFIKTDEKVMTVTGTNLNISVKIKLPIEEGIKDEFIIPFNKLKQITNIISQDDISIRRDKNVISIASGMDVFETSIIGDPKDFPLMNQPKKDSNTVVLKNNIFKKYYSKLLFSTSNNDPRTVMESFMFDFKRSKMFVTDSQTICVIDTNTESNEGWLKLHRTFAKMIAKLNSKDDEELKIVYDETNFYLAFKNIEMSALVPEGKIIEGYHNVIPKKDDCVNFIVNKNEFTNALKKCNIVSSTTHLIFDKDNIHIKSENREENEKSIAHITAKCSHEKMRMICFNNQKMQNCIDVINNEELFIYYNPSKLGAIVILSADEDDNNELVLLMPIYSEETNNENDEWKEFKV